MKPSTNPFVIRGLATLIVLYAFLALPASTFAQAVHAGAQGRVTGMVSNMETKNYLVGVEVSIPELRLQTLTDEEGRFSFNAVPFGTYILSASYSGLETERTTVTVDSEAPPPISIQLTSNVYKLETFVVTGDREGNAAAITRQRQSINLRTALSLDAIGSLPNDNIGELLATMPGVGGTPNDEGVINTVAIRGTAAQYNTVTVDGDTMQGGGTNERAADVSVLPASIFEEVEIVKAPLPEMTPTAIGGSVNIKTTSLLTVGFRKRTNYYIGMRWAPSFYDPIPAQQERPIHPQFSFSHIQVFDVGGGKKNLALLIGGGYSENMVATNNKIILYRVNPLRINDSERQLAGKDIPDEVGVYGYTQSDLISLRKFKTFNFKVEYKVSPYLSFHGNIIYSDIHRPGYRSYAHAFSTSQFLKYDPITGEQNRALLSSGKYEYGHILPNPTNKVTRVETASTENIMHSTASLTSNMDRERKFTLGGRYKRGNWDMDFSANWSIRHYLANAGGDYGQNGAGVARFALNNFGWTFDHSDTSRAPIMTPNSTGNDWYDPNSYYAIRYTVTDYRDTTDFYNARVNIRYNVPASFPLVFKTGFSFNREERGRDRYNTKEFNYSGAASFRKFIDPNARMEGRDLPCFDATLVANDLHDAPRNWTEAIYKNTMNLYLNTYNLTEDVLAGYLQGHVQFGAFRMIAGARYEHASDDVFGHTQAEDKSPSTFIASNPKAAGEHDYKNPVTRKITYTKLYPSIHALYRFSPNLQGRASWSNTIARPAPSYLYPKMTIYGPESNLDGQGSIVMNDPNIKPETSMNWDIGLEYYFEPVGQISLGYFYKDMKDFIYLSRSGIVPDGEDNGFNGDYEGYFLNEAKNGGKAKLQGIEFSYRQALSFLPGVLSGLSVFANYTWIKSEADYDNDGKKDMERVGFIPNVANAGITFKYHGLTLGVNARYADDFYRTASDNPAARIFVRSNIMVNTSLTCQVTRRFNIFVNIANITGVEQRWYQYKKDRPYRYIKVAPTIGFGISGRF